MNSSQPTPSAPSELATKAALHAVQEIQTFTRLWVEPAEEQKAAEIVLKHFAPIRAETLALSDRLKETEQKYLDLASDKNDMEQEVAGLRSQLAEAQQELDRLDPGVHSCSDTCQRPMCVLRRELKRAQQQRDAAQISFGHLQTLTKRAEALEVQLKEALKEREVLVQEVIYYRDFLIGTVSTQDFYKLKSQLSTALAAAEGAERLAQAIVNLDKLILTAKCSEDVSILEDRYLDATYSVRDIIERTAKPRAERGEGK